MDRRIRTIGVAAVGTGLLAAASLSALALAPGGLAGTDDAGAGHDVRLPVVGRGAAATVAAGDTAAEVAAQVVAGVTAVVRASLGEATGDPGATPPAGDGPADASAPAAPTDPLGVPAGASAPPPTAPGTTPPAPGSTRAPTAPATTSPAAPVPTWGTPPSTDAVATVPATVDPTTTTVAPTTTGPKEGDAPAPLFGAEQAWVRCEGATPYDEFWGWAPPRTKVTLTSSYGKVTVTSDAAGDWSARLTFGKSLPPNTFVPVTAKSVATGESVLLWFIWDRPA